MPTPRTLVPIAACLLAGGLMAAPAAAQTAAKTAGQTAGQPGATHGDARPEHHRPSYEWDITPTGSTDQFRGLAAVSGQVAWVSGEHGTVLRTTDGGSSWQDVSPRHASGLLLRDIEAFDDQQAVALSIGPGEDSRVYSTTDGGQTWTETFRNTNPDAFYDCMAFSRDGTGLAMSDPVDGYFRLARTTDFGQSWEVLPTTGMPPARDNEFGFAASGTCVISGPGHVFRIATGGTQPRIFRTWDAGNHWSVHNAPVRGGDTAGIYSIAFRWLLQGVIVGGDFNDETNGADAAASTRSGGWHWQLSREQVGGYRSGVEFVPHTLGTVVAVGPTGSDVSYDGGRTWTGFDTDWYDGVQCARDGACWASGTDGRVAKLQRSWR